MDQWVQRRGNPIRPYGWDSVFYCKGVKSVTEELDQIVHFFRVECIWTKR